MVHIDRVRNTRAQVNVTTAEDHIHRVLISKMNLTQSS